MMGREKSKPVQPGASDLPVVSVPVVIPQPRETFRSADIISEGTRIAAEVFPPTDSDGKVPTIIMSHGWSGTGEALRPDAVVFARAGFLVVKIDYRGWGKGDSRLIAVGMPEMK